MESCKANGIGGDICRGIRTCMWHDHLVTELMRGDDISAYTVPGSVNAYGGCVMERQCLALINRNTPKKKVRKRR